MRIKKVEYVEEYKLRLLFNDNKVKIVDIKPIIDKSKRIFKPLKDIEYFKKVALDDEQYPLSICWPNGADICPDYLYEIGVEVKMQTGRKPFPSTPRRGAHSISIRSRSNIRHLA